MARSRGAFFENLLGRLGHRFSCDTTGGISRVRVRPEFAFPDRSFGRKCRMGRWSVGHYHPPGIAVRFGSIAVPATLPLPHPPPPLEFNEPTSLSPCRGL